MLLPIKHEHDLHCCCCVFVFRCCLQQPLGAGGRTPDRGRRMRRPPGASSQGVGMSESACIGPSVQTERHRRNAEKQYKVQSKRVFDFKMDNACGQGSVRWLQWLQWLWRLRIGERVLVGRTEKSLG